MDLLALVLALVAAFALSPWAALRLRVWGVTLLILSAVAQLTHLTGHAVNTPFSG